MADTLIELTKAIETARKILLGDFESSVQLSFSKTEASRQLLTDLTNYISFYQTKQQLAYQAKIPEIDEHFFLLETISKHLDLIPRQELSKLKQELPKIRQEMNIIIDSICPESLIELTQQEVGLLRQLVQDFKVLTDGTRCTFSEKLLTEMETKILELDPSVVSIAAHLKREIEKITTQMAQQISAFLTVQSRLSDASKNVLFKPIKVPDGSGDDLALTPKAEGLR